MENNSSASPPAAEESSEPRKETNLWLSPYLEKIVAQPPSAVIPPKAEDFDLRSNTAEGGCATLMSAVAPLVERPRERISGVHAGRGGTPHLGRRVDIARVSGGVHRLEDGLERGRVAVVVGQHVR